MKPWQSRPTNAEMAQFVAMLEDASLVEVYIDDEGRETYRLTEEGVRIGNTLAMVEGEDTEGGAGRVAADPTDRPAEARPCLMRVAGAAAVDRGAHQALDDPPAP